MPGDDGDHPTAGDGTDADTREGDRRYPWPRLDTDRAHGRGWSEDHQYRTQRVHHRAPGGDHPR